MEYYIFLTHKCNMSCSYCCAQQVVSRNVRKGSTLSHSQVLKVAKYIKQDIAARQSPTNRIVFYGGEPLLVCDVIRDFLRACVDVPASYALYTNGLALNIAPLDILSAMEVIFVSFDGDKNSHEKYRGKGTYERITANVAEVKNQIRVPLIGRLTVEETTKLYDSVTKMLSLCDHVYWQIVNKPVFRDAETFIRNYESGIKKLFASWLIQLRKGEIVGIIPFQAISKSLLNDQAVGRPSFRCGAGSYFMAIDIDGTIYECDEYVGTPLGQLGNIEAGPTIPLNYESHENLYEGCATCRNRSVCLGRCKSMLQTFGRDQIQIYCRLTNDLIDLVRENLKEIEKTLHDNNLEEIYVSPAVTEEIP